MTIYVILSTLYVYICRIYTYFSGENMKRKRIPTTNSLTNLNEIEDGDDEKESLIRSDVHYHFHYLNIDEKIKNINDFKINFFNFYKNINKQICYVAHDSIFCSTGCQKSWIRFKKSNF